MIRVGSGKVKVEKGGLKEITREGFEYELTINLELDTRHNATASKDRTGLFMGKPTLLPTEQTGRLYSNGANREKRHSLFFLAASGISALKNVVLTKN